MTPAALCLIGLAAVGPWLGGATSERGHTLFVVAGELPKASGHADALPYRVLVEPALAAEALAFEAAVVAALSDPQGWAAAGTPFVQVREDADLSIVLASPQTTDSLCLPLDTSGVYSCGTQLRAVLNRDRWLQGAKPWPHDDLDGYRRYMVNHEVGHLIGLSHKPCRKPGESAPIMLQQTIDLDGCVANPLPTPDEIKRLARRWVDRPWPH